MRIEIKEKDKVFFDECLYIQIYIKKILRNLNKKVWSASNVFFKGMLMYFLYTLLFIIIGFNEKFNFLVIIFICISLVSFLIMVYNYYVVKKQINLYMNSGSSESVFEIDEDGVRLNNSTGVVEVKWDSVKYILINKNTISFLPGDVLATNIIMFISTKYKDKVMDAIKKYKKEELVIDNSKLYK